MPLNESKDILDKGLSNQLKNSIMATINWAKEDLKKVEEELEKLIEEDAELNKSYKLAKSVPCIGKLSAMYLLMSTDNFTKIKTYGQGASYGSIAPFSCSSGRRLRGKTRISSMGDKCLKSLLHICSLSVLKQKKGELWDYYERKISEGKNTMSVLNALRNKLLSRVFACVNNGVKYDPCYGKN